ncbi:MAG: hypothetical protein M3Y08_13715 [Fibrobacterota bacterium]|nr:hypothetical protein [Fibrobacterota bacterium]
MKRFKQLFHEAERITPPPGLWRKIQARVDLSAGGDSTMDARPMSYWESPFLRVAAAVVLALGLLATGFFLTWGPEEMATSVASSTVAADEGDVIEIFDSELLGWQAELGETSEMDSEAEEAEEAGEVL